MNNSYEKNAHKGLDYGKDQLEPSDTHSRVVRVVNRSDDFSWFQGVPKGREKLLRKDLMGCASLHPSYGSVPIHKRPPGRKGGCLSADTRELFAPKHVHDAVPSDPGPEKNPSRVIRDDLPYAA